MSVAATFLPSTVMIVSQIVWYGGNVVEFVLATSGARLRQRCAGPGGVDDLDDCLTGYGGVGLVVEQ